MNTKEFRKEIRTKLKNYNTLSKEEKLNIETFLMIGIMEFYKAEEKKKNGG